MADPSDHKKNTLLSSQGSLHERTGTPSHNISGGNSAFTLEANMPVKKKNTLPGHQERVHHWKEEERIGRVVGAKGVVHRAGVLSTKKARTGGRKMPESRPTRRTRNEYKGQGGVANKRDGQEPPNKSRRPVVNGVGVFQLMHGRSQTMEEV